MDGTLRLPVSRSPRRSSPPLRLDRGVLAVALLLLAGGIGACGGNPNRTTASADLSGLVLLTDDAGRSRLTTFDAAGRARTVERPDGAPAWLSAGRRGTIVATMADGSLRLSDRIRADQKAAWKRLPGPRADLPDDPIYFATWAPNGNRFAGVATDFSEDASVSLLVVDPLADTSLIRPVAGQPLAGPPAWLDDGRVAVQTRGGIVVVGVDTGDLTAGPDLAAGAALIDVSADGTRVAIERDGHRGVEVRSRDDWLAGGGQAEASLDGEGIVGALALDRRAERLAIIWERASETGTLVVYRREGGWRESARLALPNNSQRGALTWLP
jgi:hypothetical protein